MVDKVINEKEEIMAENEELEKEKNLANLKIREQQEEIVKFKNKVIKLTQKGDTFKPDMNKKQWCHIQENCLSCLGTQWGSYYFQKGIYYENSSYKWFLWEDIGGV